MRSLSGTCCLAGVLEVAALLAAGPTWAWRVPLARSRDVGPIALDRTGAVVAAIEVPPRGCCTGAALVKLDRVNGSVRWRRRFRAGGRERLDFLGALKTTADGDLLTAGTLNDDGVRTFFVARLAARDGAVRWQRNVPGQQLGDGGSANALALDPNGDVVVAGALEGGIAAPLRFTRLDFAIVKLSAESGEERWRFVLNGSAGDYDDALAVGVDAAGDVIAVGTLSEGLPTELPHARSGTVTKLAGDDGHLVWRHDIDASSRPHGVVLDRADDIFIPLAMRDSAGDHFTVLKLAGVSGEPIWTASVGGSAQQYGEAFALALVPSGDVAAVGITADRAGAPPSLTAVLLDARTGTERWRRLLQGNDGYGVGGALAVMPGGDIFVGGQLRNRRSCYDLAFARLAAATGEVRELRSLDGTARASQCDFPVDCEGAGCHVPRAGIDMDRLSALAVDGEGRIVVAGSLSDGPRGRERGVVAAVSPRR